ncbi:hypothetical protein HAX54_037851 [Datura stramonium]|uniref:Uncharacterized protein n=1 Tax=Datura stramonium TaxID=4076 RepID=A0ABS8VMX2_DATST|nr:hypothetical protein [Datura stramonium]
MAYNELASLWAGLDSMGNFKEAHNEVTSLWAGLDLKSRTLSMRACGSKWVNPLFPVSSLLLKLANSRILLVLGTANAWVEHEYFHDRSLVNSLRFLSFQISN